MRYAYSRLLDTHTHTNTVLYVELAEYMDGIFVCWQKELSVAGKCRNKTKPSSVAFACFRHIDTSTMAYIRSQCDIVN